MATADHIDMHANNRMTFAVGETMELPTDNMRRETGNRIVIGAPACLRQAHHYGRRLVPHDVRTEGGR